MSKRRWLRRPKFAVLASLFLLFSLATLLLLSRTGEAFDDRPVKPRESAPQATRPQVYLGPPFSPRGTSSSELPKRKILAGKRGPLQATTATVDDAEPVKDEISRVMANLDRCLGAANLTEYFIQHNLIANARQNAENFINTLRRVVPTSFNSTYSSPCWETTLTMIHCDSTSGCPVPAIRGRLGSLLTYINLKYALESHLAGSLASRYPQGLSTELVCMPRFFLAGFPKCGSSYLFCLLEQLSLGVGGGQLVKEPHFWVPRGPFGDHQTPHSFRSLVPYLLNFLPTIEAEIESRLSFSIDASPNLLFQWRMYRRDEGLVNYCLTPSVLPVVLPDSKFIVVMRNPVDMLYSAFWYSCSDMNIHLDEKRKVGMPHEFHEKVLKKIQMFENCTRIVPVDKCVESAFRKLDISLQSCGRIRLEIGFYFLHIRKWLAVFPPEHFLFIAIEDLGRDKAKLVKRISDFIGLTSVRLDTLRSSLKPNFGSDFCNNVQTRYDYHHDPRLKMKEQTRNILSDFFKPYNQKLATLLHDDKFLWTE